MSLASRMATTGRGSTPCKYMFALATVPIFFDLFDMYYFMSDWFMYCLFYKDHSSVYVQCAAPNGHTYPAGADAGL